MQRAQHVDLRVGNRKVDGPLVPNRSGEVEYNLDSINSLLNRRLISNVPAYEECGPKTLQIGPMSGHKVVEDYDIVSGSN